MRILIVDDNQALASLLQEFLSDSGYDTLYASDLDEALDIAGRSHIDAAILDIDVGNRLVYPLARQLRERHVPFLFASSYRPEEIDAEFKFQPLLQKPYVIGHVMSLLRRIGVPTTPPPRGQGASAPHAREPQK